MKGVPGHAEVVKPVGVDPVPGGQHPGRGSIAANKLESPVLPIMAGKFEHNAGMERRFQ
ncbi:MAG: hypothetical protein OEW15_03580 [Nitrospirota bacterium]|nr:hypothetical protein [Nitrospirota bacterium]